MKKNVTKKRKTVLKKKQDSDTNQLKEKTSSEKTRNFFQIYFAGWKNIFHFKTRANRAEFISFWSISILLLYLFNPVYLSEWINYIAIFFSFLIMLALLSLTIRRFEDIGQKGFYGFLTFIFIFVILSHTLTQNLVYDIYYILCVFLYFFITLLPSQNCANKYGEIPLKASKTALFLTALFSVSILHSIAKLCLLFYEKISFFI